MIDKKTIKKYKWIELQFTDLIGNFHSLTLPSSKFSELKNGIGFDSSSCSGFKSVEGGDMILIPDMNTAITNNDTISFICNIYEADNKKEYDRDPRTILKKAERYLKKTNIATKALFGPEFEFFIFNEVSIKNTNNIFMTKIRMDEGNFYFNNEDTNNAEFIKTHNGYHSIPPKDRNRHIRNKIASAILDMNIKLIYHHHEVAPGQHEIEIERSTPIVTADNTQRIKYIIKQIASQNNLWATFMPKPMYNVPGSGMHFHQHLFKNNKNIFYDKKGYGGLSKTAQYYIAGLLKHAGALLALTNPSTNSYKRLVPGFEAPVKLFYSLANRSSAIRVPKYATSEKEKRIEFRPPDATCNTYLAIAGMMLAGIDGIKNRISLEDNNFGPFDINMEKASDEFKNKLGSCPRNLTEALDALEQDYDFLLQDNVFSKETILSYINYKREEEKQINRRPHPFEFELYF